MFIVIDIIGGSIGIEGIRVNLPIVLIVCVAVDLGKPAMETISPA